MYLGTPFSAPSSIKSKSSTKFSDAMTMTRRLKPMLINEEFVISKTAILKPKNPPMNWTKYKRKMLENSLLLFQSQHYKESLLTYNSPPLDKK